MKIFKKILIGLGVLTVILIILVGIAAFFISKESGKFEEKYSPLASQFLYQLSSTWNIADVQDSLTNDLIEELNSPKGQKIMNNFKQLGELKDIKDIELSGFNTRATTEEGSLTLGTFKFKAEFENAKALVTITLKKNDLGVRVAGFSINPTEKIQYKKQKTNI